MAGEVRPVFAIDRVKAYLAEVERKNNLPGNHMRFGDEAHVINGFELRRSDIALLLARIDVLETSMQSLIDTHTEAWSLYTLDGYRDSMAATVTWARRDTGL